LSVVVAILVIVPLIMVILGAARQAGTLSLLPLMTVLGSVTVITNTLIMGLGATVFSVAVGVMLALAIIVASKGGAPQHPNWYRNLVANPEVEVQVGQKTFKAKARTASGAERDRL
jgi:hypothetical protein